jgi:hypothetical protein
MTDDERHLLELLAHGRPARAHSGVRHRRATPSTPQTATFLARSVRGLEWLAAAEIETDLNASLLEIGHREIVFRAPLDPRVFKLGSIDDLFLLSGRIDEIDRGRLSLAKLAAVWGRRSSTRRSGRSHGRTRLRLWRCAVSTPGRLPSTHAVDGWRCGDIRGQNATVRLRMSRCRRPFEF